MSNYQAGGTILDSAAHVNHAEEQRLDVSAAPMQLIAATNVPKRDWSVSTYSGNYGQKVSSVHGRESHSNLVNFANQSLTVR